MKIIIKIIFCILCGATMTNSQSLNWNNTDTSSSHMTYFNFGLDYGITTEIGYGYKIKKNLPLWLQVDISKPMGGELFDDFKSRAGFQLKAFSHNNFAVIAKMSANYRTHSSELVSMKSWGSEASAAVGWYSSKWMVELEGGFDKAIITQLKHTDVYRGNYDGVQDDWYIPAGGNWFYGFRSGRTFGKNLLVTLEIGVTDAQGSDRNALLPRYLTFGFLKPL